MKLKINKKYLIIALVCLGVLFLAIGLRPLYPEIRYRLFGPPNQEELLLGFDVNGIATDTPGAYQEAATGTPRIMIPSIGVNMEIVADESDEQTAFARGAWLLPGTAEPGGVSGNAVIAAHRYLYTSGPNTFYHLDKLKEGNRILIDWQGKHYTYRVRDSFVVSPQMVEILKQTEKPILTLFTCHPVFTTKSRLVVTAELTETE